MKRDIGVTMIKKKIYLNRSRTKWCYVQLYNFKFDMQRDYEKYCKSRGQKRVDKILGASTHYELYSVNGKSMKVSGETGTVYLCVDHCGAGIVSHEFLHAVLYARNRSLKKEQYPIVIKNMDQEEQLLHNHTYAVMQFYNWFYKVAKEVK